MWFVPEDGIARHVIFAHVRHYFGHDASIFLGVHNGVSGFLVKAYRNFTPLEIEQLKASSAKWYARGSKIQSTNDSFPISNPYDQKYVAPVSGYHTTPDDSSYRNSDPSMPIRVPFSEYSPYIHGLYYEGYDGKLYSTADTAIQADYYGKEGGPFFPFSHRADSGLKFTRDLGRIKGLDSPGPWNTPGQMDHVKQGDKNTWKNRYIRNPQQSSPDMHTNVHNFPATTVTNPFGTVSHQIEQHTPRKGLRRELPLDDRTTTGLTTLKAPQLTVPLVGLLPQHQRIYSDVVELCGWQIGAEKFVWEERVDSADRLRKLRFLGKGATGEVDEVVMRDHMEKMARKRIYISRYKEQADREVGLIKKEAANMKKLSHLHIVKVIGCYQETRIARARYVYLLMHPAGDNDLEGFLYECQQATRRQLAQYMEWMQKWFLCLTSALAYMHSQKIYHEDIKPKNIIHRGDHILFTDFSSSRALDVTDETSTANPAIASRLYAAPEALRTDDGKILRHGSKTDVFSLGLVFVEMLVVLSDETVINFRDLILKDQGSPRQYHRAIPQISVWFKSTAPQPIYWDCFHYMLRKNRKARPSARNILAMLKKEESFKPSPRCICTDDLDADDDVDDDMDWLYITTLDE